MIRFAEVTKEYRLGNSTWKFGPVSFEIVTGESVAIVGRSGAGKSTLLHLLGGLLTPDSGTITFDSTDLMQLSENKRNEFRNRHIGFVFQEFFLIEEFSIIENVAMPLLIRGIARQQALEKAATSLNSVGLEGKFLNHPSELSGGQRQRAAIARAIIGEPALLLADEPTGNLDVETGQEIIGLLSRMNKETGATLIIVTHDPVVTEVSDRAIEIADGHIVPFSHFVKT